MKLTPIREGDCFQDFKGHIWRVIRTLPGGKVDLFDRDRSYFIGTTHQQLRLGQWKRVEVAP